MHQSLFVFQGILKHVLCSKLTSLLTSARPSLRCPPWLVFPLPPDSCKVHKPVLCKISVLLETAPMVLESAQTQNGMDQGRLLWLLQGLVDGLGSTVCVLVCEHKGPKTRRSITPTPWRSGGLCHTWGPGLSGINMIDHLTHGLFSSSRG